MMKRRETLFGIALLLFSCLAPPVSAAPGAVGQLLNVAGRVEIQRGKGPARRGTLLFPLQSGDVVKVAEGGAGQIVLFLNGARFALAAKSVAAVSPTALRPLGGPPPKPLPRLSTAFVRTMNRPAPPVSAGIMGVLTRGDRDAALGPAKP